MGRPPILGSLAALLTLVSAAFVLTGVAEVDALTASGEGPLWAIAAAAGSAVVFAAVGVIAVWRRPNNHTGVIMLAGGASLAIANLGALGLRSMTVVATVTSTATLSVLVHLLLAFPSGRLRSRLARGIVLAGYAVSLLLQAPLYLFDPAASPDGMLAVADSPAAVTIGRWTQSVAGLAVMVAAAALLVGRFQRATAAQRRVLGPLYLYGIGVVISVPLIVSVLVHIVGLPHLPMSVLQIGLVTFVPVAIGYAMLTGGFARTGDVQELGAWLSAADGSREALQAALARTLGDPSVTLTLWSDEAGTFVADDGRPVPVGERTGSGSVDVLASGRRVAVIEYDATLIDQPETVAAAGRVIAMAIDRARMAADLRASRDELRESRARIVHAGDEQRRRLAQDLHDGLQSQLVLLGIEAQALAGLPGAADDVATAATALRLRIDAAAAELRALVHAVMPPALAADGLAAAVEDLLDRMPVPARLEMTAPAGAAQADPHVQSAAYFVIAEGLTNAVKHAAASTVVVRLATGDGRLQVEVIDDGVGFDRAAAAGMGLGLRSVADRVSAFGGRLTITRPDGGGTRLTAELPCAS